MKLSRLQDPQDLGLGLTNFLGAQRPAIFVSGAETSAIRYDSTQFGI